MNRNFISDQNFELEERLMYMYDSLPLLTDQDEIDTCIETFKQYPEYFEVKESELINISCLYDNFFNE